MPRLGEEERRMHVLDEDDFGFALEIEIEIPALGHSVGAFIDSDHAAYREAETILHDLQHDRIPGFLKRARAVHAAFAVRDGVARQ